MGKFSLEEVDQPLCETSRTNQQVETPSASSLEPSTDVALSQELVLEILLRLPVKSILRFQNVSKTWRSLITRPDFSRSHLNFLPRGGHFFNHQLLFTTNSILKQCPLHSVLHKPCNTHLYDLDCPFLQTDESISVVGSVNGLVCLTKKIDLFLWYPVLRESKHLPSSNIRVEDSRMVRYGFGYDEVNDDYKVVSLFYEYLGEDEYKTEVKVYSLRTNSWRTIEDFKVRAPMNDTGKYVSGKIHWTATGPPGSRWDWKIVSLDMTNEIYGELKPPNFGDVPEAWELKVVGGKLGNLER